MVILLYNKTSSNRIVSFCSYFFAFKKASKFKLKKGIHVVEPDKKKFYEKIKEGFDMIAYSLDIRMLDVACRNITSEIKKIK